MTYFTQIISIEWLLLERYGEYMRHITFLPHICCAQFRHQFAWFVNCRNVCTCVYSTCIVHATRIVYCSGLPQPQLRYGCLVGSDPFQGRDFSSAQVPTIHYLKTTQLLSTHHNNRSYKRHAFYLAALRLCFSTVLMARCQTIKASCLDDDACRPCVLCEPHVVQYT